MSYQKEAKELETLWAEHLTSYCESCPEVEPSVDFMPRLWQRIESRNTYRRRVESFARYFITAAGAACLVLTSLLVVPSSSKPTLPYVDALAEYSAAHAQAEIQAAHIDPQPED